MVHSVIETSQTGPVTLAEGQRHWSLPEVLQELAADGGAEILIELIEAFRVDSLARLTSIQRAVAMDDRKSIQEGAHCLKGSALQLGATFMASICLKMERGASVLSNRELQDHVVHLRSEFETVCLALDAFSESITVPVELRN